LANIDAIRRGAFTGRYDTDVHFVTNYINISSKKVTNDQKFMNKLSMLNHKTPY